ncbi:hypothetical protein BO94DRAFT_278331 [Aspergillus sclerotioniger CBS 115572]|uniref:DUF7053 domain-containing protein n=1 Tax=Aspergillus sclerotioniger CBS 115572 TaxID=1450535 RepID=A0A317X7I3_9EURO|nr:hypothetical protein BO94DRAFT_278331 [Aspergillus sclerotioniger CBS 115572]PWY94564.1 hypothetical protein BO94DRAFT_278331 [Aspergillus sclerotioniger CBS 115572]
MLRKKETYTITTPLPPPIPRHLAISILHSHSEIISLNPLVISHHAIKAPRNAPADEYYSTWYEITERVRYVPRTISFNGCFHDEPWGLRTHTYAPMGVDLRNSYRIVGEDGGGGLSLREDVEVECNLTLIAFVKSQLRAASKMLVDRLIKKAELVDRGVLQVSLEDGVLRTFNPADRSCLEERERERERERRWSYQSMPKSPSGHSREGSMTSQGFAPPRYGQDFGPAELPADTFYSVSGQGQGQGKYRPPSEGGYPAELAAMDERGEQRRDVYSA